MPAVGAVLATVTVAADGVARAAARIGRGHLDAIASPRSPLPASERSSVAAVAPVMAVPLRSQRYL